MDQVASGIHKACKSGSLGRVKEIIESVIDVRHRVSLLSVRDDDGCTPLHIAARFSVSEILMYLINSVPAKDIINILSLCTTSSWPSNSTALHLSALYNDTSDALSSLVKFLISAYNSETAADTVVGILMSQTEWGSTFLHVASRYRSVVQVGPILTEIPSTHLMRIISVREKGDLTVLHNAVLNEKHEDMLSLLLTHLVRYYRNVDVEEILLSADHRGQTFLHTAAKYGSAQMMKNIISVLPKDIAMVLCKKRDIEGLTSRFFTRPGQQSDYLDQAGSYPVDCYHLDTPPKVLIFYSTRNRLMPAVHGGITLAQKERECIEMYFNERWFPCKSVRDCTSDDIFSEITAAVIDPDLSGLLVFVMSHGENGLVSVKGDPGFLAVEEIMLHMCCGTEGKPKVLIIQACQMKQIKTTEWSAQSTGTGGISIGDITSSEATGDPEPAVWGRVDPTARGSMKQQAINEGMSLKRRDFLLYMATVSGTSALRHVMIPNLISSLRELSPSDCITDACQSANLKIANELLELDPTNSVGQLPKMEMTLKKKLCIAKKFTLKFRLKDFS